MRLHPVRLALLLVVATLALASPPPIQEAVAKADAAAAAAAAKDGVLTEATATTTSLSASASPSATVPDKVKAPELLELKTENFWDTIASGYWFVKHYSPTCGHCIAAAPIWQALADYYVTTPLQANVAAGSPKSHPDSPAAAPSFTETYKFNFANLNCVANGDICGIEALKIRAYPTFNLYKDGKLLEQFSQSTHELPELTRFVEKHLSQIKPDSRPKEPPVVPEKADETEAEKKKKADAKAADEPDTSNAVQPAVAKPKSPANPDGDSIPLDAETFQKLVLTTRDGWFIKFYAPWCTHCQAMAPAWAELGRQMRGELNIGEVNCEIEKRLCKDVRLRGYPTILYFQNGERVEYDGLRGLGDLVSYARKAVNSGVREVDQAQFDEMEKKGEVEVAFLYFYDQATTSEDFEALERLTLNLIGHAPLLKTKSYALARRFRVTTWPRLIVIRDGRPSYYTALSPRDLRDYKKVLQWMRSVWLPIVPELSAANSHEIMNGRTVVLGILSRNKPEAFATAKKELKAAALEYMDKMQNEETNRKQELRDQKQLRIEEAEDRNDERALRQAKNIKIILPARREVGFAWVDGVFWERWVRSTYGVNVEADGERIIINEQDTKSYWDQTISGEPIRPSRSAILETLRAILNTPGKIKSKSTSSRIETLFLKARVATTNHPWLASGIMVAVVVAVATYGRGRMRSRRGGNGGGGFFQVGEAGSKGGLLGASSSGKFD